MLRCLVDKKHLLHYGHRSTYSEIATKAGVSVEDCQQYRFDLITREIFNDSPESVNPFFAKTSRDKIAKDFFDASVGTPEKLMEFVKTNRLNKVALAALLDGNSVRPFYLDVCATVERLITKHCASKTGQHCLEGGCPFVEDGICTEACNREEPLYDRACVNIWLELFRCSRHRIDAWRR